MTIPGLRTHSKDARALLLLSALEEQPMSAAELCEHLGWTRSQFSSALSHARDVVCPTLGVTIPHPVPEDGFQYRVTGQWMHDDGTPAIEAGTAYAVSLVETRLHSILRDVRVAKDNLDGRSVNGRKANFLDKHLTHILAVLAEIGTPSPRDMD